ncbi:Serine/threonine-protein phosphatase 4 catalytic subunit [Dirofilaria immitis]
MPRNSVIQHTLPCPPLQQEEIDQLIHGMLNTSGVPEHPLSELITLEKLFFICHKTVDLLRECGTLEYIHDPDGVAIFGDLHGSLYDLYRGIKDAGWPTERTLIFLGDYIDRGKHSLVILLFLFLLKLRYPKRMYMLRGNHETMSQCYANEDEERGLIRNIEYCYPNADRNLILFNINFVFDHLPLAAILSDQVLLCHGGISQFIRSRRDIAQIPRPLTWLAPETNVFHISIMTDILWSDPSKEITSKYSPSERGASYFFNRRALKEKLRELNCRALIRGHEANTSGFVKVFNGLCYTVHSSPAVGDEYYVAAILLLDFDEITKLLHGRVVYHSTKGNLEHLREDLVTNFEEVRHLYPLNPVDQNKSQCWSCMRFMEGVSEAIFKWQRCLSHFDYYMIMQEYRIGEHYFPFEEGFFDEMDSITEDNVHELYRVAALQYPKFLTLLISENYLLSRNGIQQPDKVPEYDFKFVLPPSEGRWPFLEIHD